MDKYKFSSVDAQIGILESRGMIAHDKDRAKSFLLDNNYYNVVNAFKKYIIDEDAGEEKYKEGVRFEDLVCLYRFDERLRATFLRYILIIEGQLKTHLAYEFSKAYGPMDYLRLNVYNRNDAMDVERAESFISQLKVLISKNAKSNDMVKHFVSQEDAQMGLVPLWALVNVLDFGTLRRFYSNLNSNVVNYIARRYYSLPPRTLQTMIYSLNACRNMCAHGSCLIRFRMKDRGKQISDTDLHRVLCIPDEKGNYLCGKRDLFSIVICLKYLLPEKGFSKFFDEFDREVLLLEKSLQSSPISAQDVFKEMGLPPSLDGEGKPLWKELRNLSIHDQRSTDTR